MCSIGFSSKFSRTFSGVGVDCLDMLSFLLRLLDFVGVELCLSSLSGIELFILRFDPLCCLGGRFPSEQ